MSAKSLDLWEAFQIPKEIEIKQAEFFLDMELLPRQYITGEIRLPARGANTSAAAHRCTILDKEVVAQGRSGIIRRVDRTPPPAAVSGQAAPEVCIKLPKNPLLSFCPEAILQSICSRALTAAGIHGAVPEVYDIYRFANETRYSMEYIRGVSAVDAVLSSPTPDTTLLQILAQAALILGFLEERVRLDHRDLKADNLWIRPRPVSYTLQVGGVEWHLAAPFQVVFLDFGFACIGGDDGQAVVSLTDGVVPLIDPCPKEGRDLFQLIGSMWSVPEVRDRIGPDVTADVELLLKHRSASYIELVRNTTQSTWIYIAVSDLKFRHPVLHPVSLLERLAHEWYPTAGVSIQAADISVGFLGSSRPGSARPHSAQTNYGGTA